MKLVIVAIIFLLSGCAHSEMVPVVFWDADQETGKNKQAQWFEGELRYSSGDLFIGHIHLKKYIGPWSRWVGKPEWYTGEVKKGVYGVWFTDGGLTKMVYGHGYGAIGIMVRPSWLPDVEKIAAQLPKEDGK